MKSSKEEKVNIIQKNPENPFKQKQANAENEKELIEKHKMLINLYNIQQDIEGDNNDLETDVEKIENEDTNSCTRDYNDLVVIYLI